MVIHQFYKSWIFLSKLYDPQIHDIRLVNAGLEEIVLDILRINGANLCLGVVHYIKGFKVVLTTNLYCLWKFQNSCAFQDNKLRIDYRFYSIIV